MLAVLIFGVLAGLDNLQVCSGLGLLPIGRARKLLVAAAFAVCETLAPLAGLAAGHLALRLPAEVAAKAGPVILLACGIAVLLLAFRQEDVTNLVNRRAMLFGLPLSLSLDNLAAGVGLGAVHYPVVWSALLIGLVSGAMSCAGLYLGALLLGPSLRRFVPGRLEYAVGAYLCLLAARMIFVHSA
jgi:putative Mn2+ efflux pump MntP